MPADFESSSVLDAFFGPPVALALALTIHITGVAASDRESRACSGDLVALVLQREVARVEQVEFRVGQIAQYGCAPSTGKITSFCPQTISVGGRRERKNAWNCGYSATLLP